jgi:uncharacterized protein YdcH (DUF465 family)
VRVDHRDLHDDFPEFAQRIHELKVESTHFKKLFDEYDSLNHRIRRIELDDVPMGEPEFEKLKYTRIQLKDQLYTMLKAG